uniref:Non-specific lipid-transfer protein n=1 Tax=Kalanchoe fedtschenkoi TaxID=63787 RepID=A0A7N0UZL2_KALFE
MASKAAGLIAAAVLLCALAAYASAAGITCSQVAASLGPCINFAKGTGGTPPAPCCAGIRRLNSMAATTPDRQATCRCLKSLAGSISGINFGLVAKVPSECGVNVPYKISPSTDCNSVK